MSNRITNINELARYKTGEAAWWVVLRPIKTVSKPLENSDQWMMEHHPKVLFQRGPCKNVWNRGTRLPHLHHMDFALITNIMTSRMVVEEFYVNDIIRSNDTGEFFYANEDNEWMPESYLFDSKAAARRERARIVKMIKQWTYKN